MNEFSSKKSILAIIPARAGSKRLKNKNMLKLGKFPLIQWTIQAAQKSHYISHIVVSSDDIKIKELCENLNVSFIDRPQELAKDTSTSLDAILHAIDHLKKQGYCYDYILLLQPTSPFRTCHHIDEACRKMDQLNADSIISLRESKDHPVWSKQLDSVLDISNFIDKKYLNKRKQDLPQFYTLNGAIYLIKTEKLISQNSIYLESHSYGYLMSENDSLDIDTMLDFKLAEVLLRDIAE